MESALDTKKVDRLLKLCSGKSRARKRLINTLTTEYVMFTYRGSEWEYHEASEDIAVEP